MRKQLPFNSKPTVQLKQYDELRQFWQGEIQGRQRD
jgi:hypothetical protein